MKAKTIINIAKVTAVIGVVFSLGGILEAYFNITNYRVDCFVLASLMWVFVAVIASSFALSAYMKDGQRKVIEIQNIYKKYQESIQNSSEGTQD